MADLGMAFMNPLLATQQLAASEGSERRADAQERRAEAKLPADLAHTAATTRYNNASADRMETETTGEKKAAALMAAAMGGEGGTPAKGGSIAEMLMKQAGIYAEAGLPVKAGDMMAKASAAAARENTARLSGLKDQFQQLQQGKLQMDMISKLLSPVKQASTPEEGAALWKKANEAFTQMTGMESPFANIPYDPKLVDLLEEGTLKAKDRADLARKEAEAESRIKARESQERHQRTMEELARQRVGIARDRAGRVAKVGGKDVGAPGKSEIDAASRVIRSDEIGAKLAGEDREAAAFAVASEARALRKANPGMSADDAIRQATTAAKASGAFTVEKTGGYDIPLYGKVGEKEVGKYRPPAAVAAKPVPQGATKASLVPGTVYTMGGRTALWTKNGWAPAPTKTAPKSAARYAPAALDDDDEED